MDIIRALGDHIAPKIGVFEGSKKTGYGRTDGPMDGPTDGWTDGPMDGQTLL